MVDHFYFSLEEQYFSSLNNFSFYFHFYILKKKRLYIAFYIILIERGSSLKKIKIIQMGGTISARGERRLDLKDYISGVYKGQDFIEAIPELQDIAEIEFESFLNVSSTVINPSHWIQLRDNVKKSLIEENFDGIVITHGTNTLEETAYFLHLTVPSNKPIVFVGAQRPFTALSSDAHLNIIQAVRVATNNNSYNKGVLVVLNDEISSARDVSKTNTYRLETFQSGQLGFLGFIDPDEEIHFYRNPTKTHTIHSEFATTSFFELPNVEIVYSYAGATGHLIYHIIDTKKYAGIVVAGTGAGLVSPGELEALKAATDAGIFVVRSSRVGNGRVMPIKPYKNYSFISGDNLLPQKARILLMLSLTKYNHFESIQQIFNTY